MFYVPAVAGGVFGLVGGYLTDRLGRRRILTWSILLYSISAFWPAIRPRFPCCSCSARRNSSAFASSLWPPWHGSRNCFPNRKQRQRVLGYTQAFSSFGGMLVAVANSLAISLAKDLPPIVVPEFAASWWGTIDPAST